MSTTVFISAKSEDFRVARQVYDHLSHHHGVSCFFSDHSLIRFGRSEYKRIIDAALDEATHLVLVTSSLEHAESEWVHYEWDSFYNELLAGRKSGNIITVLSDGMTISQLPYALRSRQALIFPSQLDQLISYLREGINSLSPKSKSRSGARDFNALRMKWKALWRSYGNKVGMILIVGLVIVEAFRIARPAAAPAAQIIPESAASQRAVPSPRTTDATPPYAPAPPPPPKVQLPVTMNLLLERSWLDFTTKTIKINGIEVGKVPSGAARDFVFYPAVNGRNLLEATIWTGATVCEQTFDANAGQMLRMKLSYQSMGAISSIWKLEILSASESK